MGTNFYLMSKNKDSVKKYFGQYPTDDAYSIVDEPYLGYQMHICKRSYGWKPLFQKHDCFNTFAEFEDFYKNNSEDYQIYDEYDELYSFEKFKQAMIDHANVEPKPVKWVYENNPIFNLNGRKTLDTKDCDESEADLYVPFDHDEYQKTYEQAKKKFGYYDLFSFDSDYGPKYTKDPDYNFDWTEGDFS